MLIVCYQGLSGQPVNILKRRVFEIPYPELKYFLCQTIGNEGYYRKEERRIVARPMEVVFVYKELAFLNFLLFLTFVINIPTFDVI